jgi:uracil-DNA glycosylase
LVFAWRQFSKAARKMQLAKMSSKFTMPPMSSAYDQLLGATIQHLEDLKARGVRHIAAAPETLRSLSQPPPRQAAPAATTLARPESAQVSPPARPVADVKPTAAARALFSLSGIPPSPTVVPLDPTTKAAAFAELRNRAQACVKCSHLAASRKHVVFGVGNIDSPLMFVGEAPGADEDEQGEPFVGKAGQLLTKIIQAMDLQRGNVYIGNILKCRPDTPGQAAGNRKPTSNELATCIPFLHEQIDLIQPKVLVALGATAVEGLLGKTMGITKLRGTWKSYRNIPLMPTYHPAYLLRNQAMSEKRKVWEDMLEVMEKLQMTISEKQRRFFTRT